MDNLSGKEVINYLQMEFWNLPENVSLARVVVTSLVSSLDITISELDELKVALSEAVTNAVIHAYPEGKRGKVFLAASLYNDGVEIVVEDKGIGILDIDKAMEVDYSTKEDRMGLGLSLVRAFSNSLLILSEGNGTKVTFYKEFSSLLPKPII